MIKKDQLFKNYTKCFYLIYTLSEEILGIFIDNYKNNNKSFMYSFDRNKRYDIKTDE